MAIRPLPLLLLLFVAPASLALDGVIEINQQQVESSGGFPFVIGAPGSYALTGNLLAPPGTQAIAVRSDDVVLDLRGFEIEGPHPCNTAGCSAGTTPGIGVDFETGGSSRITVRGGSVRGFPGPCILLGAEAYVTEMSVSACGGVGIQVSAGSLVRDNRVAETGREGIRLIQDAGFAGNVVRRSGLAFQTAQPSVSGGVPVGPNLCEDGGCPLPARGYYLSQAEGDGATAPTLCDPDFHMASTLELLGGDLRYDTARGRSFSGSGSGPVNLAAGWVRTGGGPTPSCQDYTSTLGTGLLFLFLTEEIDDGSGVDRIERVPRVLRSDCDLSRPTWCVAD